MKNKKTIGLGVVLLMMVGFSSCKKEEVQINLTEPVVGTYQGVLTNSSLKTDVNSTSTITYYNDYTVKVHCVGGDMDTTFLLELYPEGDMMKVCATGDDYYNEYGHEKSNGDHMMGGSNMMSWGEHMSNDHNSGDEHYGDFDTKNNEFDYTFKMQSSSGNYTEQFVGRK